MGTKENILEASLRLFNEQGTSEITIRDIAEVVGISHGNLRYHYPQKGDIIMALFTELVKEIDALIDAAYLQPEAIGIASSYFGMEHTYRVMYKYRFLMVDKLNISRTLPVLKKEYNALYERRRPLFIGLFQAWIAMGYLRPEIMEMQADNLFVQLFIISDSWISESEFLYTGKEENKLEYFARMSFSIFVPYFTEKGLKEYNEWQGG